MTIEAAVGRKASMEMVTPGKVSGALGGLLHWPGPRLLLRPHESGGRVQPYPYLGHIFWTIGGPVSGAAFFDTRAQAAREADRE